MPLLLLHGFTGSGEAWVEDSIAALSTERRVILVDLLGHGRSDAPTDPGRYTVSRMVHDLTDVLDTLAVERAAWLGYSMGGRLALAAAVLLPQRVDRLILESASPGLKSEAEREERRRADDELASRLEAEGIGAFVEYWMSRPLFQTQRRLEPRVREGEYERRGRNRPHALAACLRGCGTGSQPSFWGELPRITAPTLVIAGEEDGKFAEIGREMTASLPNAAMVSVARAGHAVHLERPGEWTDAARSFLREDQP